MQTSCTAMVALADFMTQWLNEVVALNVKPSSMQAYQTFFKNQIAPHLGEVKVQELTPAMLDEWIRKLLRAGFSCNTLANTHILLRNALNYAVYPAQLIQSNPADYIKVPKNAPRNVIKRHIITPKKYAALLEKHIPLMLLYHTGMRISEVLSLSWTDIDFAKKRINLWRQISYKVGYGHFYQTLKNDSSTRFIIIDDSLS